MADREWECFCGRRGRAPTLFEARQQHEFRQVGKGKREKCLRYPRWVRNKRRTLVALPHDPNKESK